MGLGSLRRCLLQSLVVVVLEETVVGHRWSRHRQEARSRAPSSPTKAAHGVLWELERTRNSHCWAMLLPHYAWTAFSRVPAASKAVLVPVQACVSALECV